MAGVGEAAVPGESRDGRLGGVQVGQPVPGPLQPPAQDPLRQRNAVVAAGPDPVQVPHGHAVDRGDLLGAEPGVGQVRVDVQGDAHRQRVGEGLMPAGVFDGRADQRGDQVHRGASQPCRRVDAQVGDVRAEGPDVPSDERVERAGGQPVRRPPDQVDRQGQQRRLDEHDLVVVDPDLPVAVGAGGVLQGQVAGVLDVLVAVAVQVAGTAPLEAHGHLLGGRPAYLARAADDLDAGPGVAQQVHARTEVVEFDAMPRGPRGDDVAHPLRYLTAVEGRLERVVAVIRLDILTVQDQHRRPPIPSTRAVHTAVPAWNRTGRETAGRGRPRRDGPPGVRGPVPDGGG